MKKYILLGVACTLLLSSGCMGFLGKKVKGDDKSIKKTQIAGAIVETKVDAKADVKAMAKIDAKAEVKADVKATGADLSKKTSITGGQHIEGVDMKTLAYIIGAFMALLTTIMTAIIADAKILAGKFMRQLSDARGTILDLGNDSKELFLKITPLFILMHDKEAYESFMKFKIEYEGKIDAKTQEAFEKATPKKKCLFRIFKKK